MKRTIRNVLVRTLVVGTVLGGTVALTPDAAAQQGKQKQKEEIRPPTPKKADKAPVLWSILGVIVCVGAAMATLIPSKRGHQD